MALSSPIRPDVPMAPVRDWSCPLHSAPWHDEDDPSDDVGCLGCRYGKWVDRLDEDGEQVLGPVYTVSDISALLVTLSPPVWLADTLCPTMKINWLEDSFDGAA